MYYKMQAQNLTHTQNESMLVRLTMLMYLYACVRVFPSDSVPTELVKISEPFLGKKEAKQIFQIDILPNWEKVRRKRTQKMHLCNDGYLSKTFEHMFPALICVKFYSFVVSFLLWNYVIAKKMYGLV